MEHTHLCIPEFNIDTITTCADLNQHAVPTRALRLKAATAKVQQHGREAGLLVPWVHHFSA